MRLSRLLAVALAAAVLPAAVQVQSARAQEQPRGIRVSGQGVVTAPPDVAFLTLGASVRRDTAGEAFTRAEELVAALTDVLKGAGVADRDIQTRQFSLTPEYGRSVDNQPAPLIGWRAVHTVAVKLRDFTTIGATIDQSVRALGAEALVQGISFGIEDTNALIARARDAAIADARSKAEALAGRLGVRVGRLVYVAETSSPPPTPTQTATDGVVAAPAFGVARSAVISTGEQSLTVSVECIFDIE